jgi:cellulose synthase/poly-beta-1,6-N-acetylglucosamine synthase-like glycosyltransferase
MTFSGIAIQAAYFGVLSTLALYGLHRLFLVLVYLRRTPERTDDPALPAAGGWPALTVQLPVYNERYVIERLIGAACSMTYPGDRPEIQVLDDSDDSTTELIARLVESYRAAGHDIHHVRRNGRDGFKAGALAHGLERARGELIALFDADFVPSPDFLERTVPALRDPGVGMVQARWGHINREFSLLTRAQAMMLDAHFIVEHGARHASGLFFNFNGTAGVFRRRCIEEAGGWRGDTLTEDLDLSYRAQLAGWRFDYRPEVVAGAELPVELNALRSQQRRWAKGSIQTAIKLLPAVMRAPLPRRVKLEAILHLTNNLPYLLLTALAVLIVPALDARAGNPLGYLLLDLPLLLAGTGSFFVFCAVAQRAARSDWERSLVHLPVLMAIGIGLCLNNGLAVLDGLTGRVSAFRRTPKYRVEPSGRDGGRGWERSVYRGPRSTVILIEAAFAIHFVAAIVSAVSRGQYAGLPFLLLFAAGFVYMTGLTLAQEIARLSADPWEEPRPSIRPRVARHPQE